eukprot:IDg12882t1
MGDRTFVGIEKWTDALWFYSHRSSHKSLYYKAPFVNAATLRWIDYIFGYAEHKEQRLRMLRSFLMHSQRLASTYTQLGLIDSIRGQSCCESNPAIQFTITFSCACFSSAAPASPSRISVSILKGKNETLYWE